MKTELTIKDLCGYLPYGLKFGSPEKNYFEFEMKGIVGNFILSKNEFRYKFSDFKPFLLPLSALTEPLSDGTVPIVEMAKMFHEDDEYDITSYEKPCKLINEYRVECHIMNSKYRFAYYSIPCDQDKMQKRVVEYLYSIHVDVHGLIDAGLAIDKRTIK